MGRRYRRQYPPLSAEQQAKMFAEIMEEEEFEAAEWWVSGVPVPEEKKPAHAGEHDEADFHDDLPF